MQIGKETLFKIYLRKFCHFFQQKVRSDFEKNSSKSEKKEDEDSSLMKNVKQSSKVRRDNSQNKRLKIKKSAKSEYD